MMIEERMVDKVYDAESIMPPWGEHKCKYEGVREVILAHRKHSELGEAKFTELSNDGFDFGGMTTAKSVVRTHDLVDGKILINSGPSKGAECLEKHVAFAVVRRHLATNGPATAKEIFEFLNQGHKCRYEPILIKQILGIVRRPASTRVENASDDDSMQDAAPRMDGDSTNLVLGDDVDAGRLLAHLAPSQPVTVHCQVYTNVAPGGNSTIENFHAAPGAGSNSHGTGGDNAVLQGIEDLKRGQEKIATDVSIVKIKTTSKENATPNSASHADKYGEDARNPHKDKPDTNFKQRLFEDSVDGDVDEDSKKKSPVPQNFFEYKLAEKIDYFESRHHEQFTQLDDLYRKQKVAGNEANAAAQKTMFQKDDEELQAEAKRLQELADASATAVMAFLEAWQERVETDGRDIIVADEYHQYCQTRRLRDDIINQTVQMPDVIEAEGQEIYSLVSNSLDARSGGAALGSCILKTQSDCFLMFSANPLDPNFDEDAHGTSSPFTTAMICIFDEVSSNSLEMTVLDEDDDEVDVVLYTSCKEPLQAAGALSQAFTAFCVAAKALKPSHITLGSNTIEGTAIVPVSEQALTMIRDLDPDGPEEIVRSLNFTLANATVGVGQQKKLAAVVKGVSNLNLMLTFTRCRFDMEARSYPLLKYVPSGLRVVFQEEVNIGFSHLIQAVRGGKVKSIHLEKISWRLGRENELATDLTVDDQGRPTSLRQLYNAAKDNGCNVTLGNCEHPLDTAGFRLKDYMEGDDTFFEERQRRQAAREAARARLAAVTDLTNLYDQRKCKNHDFKKFDKVEYTPSNQTRRVTGVVIYAKETYVYVLSNEVTLQQLNAAMAAAADTSMVLDKKRYDNLERLD